MSANQRVAFGALVIAGVTGYMVYLGASSSWQYYVTVDECAAGADALRGAKVRVSGRIAAGTLQVAEDRREAAFAMQGTQGNLAVTCLGPLPDNLAEGIDVVVEGRLEEPHRLAGQKVITRCASKYQSRDASGPTQTAARPAPGMNR